MAKTAAKKGAKSVKQMVVRLTPEMHHALRARALAEHTTVQSFLTDLIEQALAKGGKEKN